MDVIALLAGVAALVLGAVGLSGRLDDPVGTVRLYRQSGNVDAAQHRRGQRFGGGALVVAGVIFISFAAARLLS